MIDFEMKNMNTGEIVGRISLRGYPPSGMAIDLGEAGRYVVDKVDMAAAKPNPDAICYEPTVSTIKMVKVG